MNPRVQEICAPSGPVGLVVFSVGLIVAGWFPPLSPHQTTLRVARRYVAHAAGVRTGCLLVAAGGALIAQYVGVISAQMEEMTDEGGPLHGIQLGLWMLGVLLFTVSILMWRVAAYLVHWDLQMTRALQDVGWIACLAAVCPAILRSLAVAIAIYTDKRRACFPSPGGPPQHLASDLLLPSILVLSFLRGPFHWDGLFTLWLAATVFGAWFPVMVTCLLKAIKRQAKETILTAGVAPVPASAPRPVSAA